MTFAALIQLCKDFSLARASKDYRCSSTTDRLSFQAPHLISLHQLRKIYELTPETSSASIRPVGCHLHLLMRVAGASLNMIFNLITLQSYIFPITPLGKDWAFYIIPSPNLPGITAQLRSAECLDPASGAPRQFRV